MSYHQPKTWTSADAPGTSVLEGECAKHVITVIEFPDPEQGVYVCAATDCKRIVRTGCADNVKQARELGETWDQELAATERRSERSSFSRFHR